MDNSKVYIFTGNDGIEGVYSTEDKARAAVWEYYLKNWLRGIILSEDNPQEVILHDWETLRDGGYIEDVGYIENYLVD